MEKWICEKKEINLEQISEAELKRRNEILRNISNDVVFKFTLYASRDQPFVDLAANAHENGLLYLGEHLTRNMSIGKIHDIFQGISDEKVEIGSKKFLEDYLKDAYIDDECGCLMNQFIEASIKLLPYANVFIVLDAASYSCGRVPIDNFILREIFGEKDMEINDLKSQYNPERIEKLLKFYSQPMEKKVEDIRGAVSEMIKLPQALSKRLHILPANANQIGYVLNK
jgi:hypothetical protein